MSSTNQYTAKDIERYHRGGMTPAEQHQLEKAALDDPLLADALEGYPYTATAANDLQSLQNRLQQRIKEKEKLIIFNRQWLKIAALFVLIGGGGWLVFQTFSGRTTDRARSGVNMVESTNPLQTKDSTVTVQNTAPVFPADSVFRSDEVVASGTARSKERTLRTTSPSLVPPPALQEAAANEEKTSTSAATGAEAAEIKEQSEIVAFKNNTPANTRRVAADTGKQTGDLAQANSPKAENTIAAVRMQSVRARKPATPENAEPEGGWQAFEKYLAENRRSVTETKQPATPIDSVALRFTVDQEGRPVNIIVEKPLCAKCDEEAIRLLKEGPKWKGKSGKVKIPMSP